MIATRARVLGVLVVTLLLTQAGVVAVADLGPLPADGTAHRIAPALVPFDITALKKNWRKRIEAVRAKGILPIIDIESSFNAERLNLPQLAQSMDEAGVALIAFSSDARGTNWSDAAAQVVSIDPWRFIPTTNGGNNPAWMQAPKGFLAQTKKHVASDKYPLMGEFEFRHYPSPRQYWRREMHRDVTVPINGELGHELFAFAEQSGVPFQIHYEIEDVLLPPLEEMLRRYPKTKVIWCHLAQIRYASRSTIYGPDYVRRLIETYPNLYFDVAFGGPDSVYPGSREHHARIWDRAKGGILKEWSDLISHYPWRFLAAMDLGGDRQDQVLEHAQRLRMFLNYLPENAREVVAYKAAWKLLFGEDL